jgi:hypothetical protein
MGCRTYEADKQGRITIYPSLNSSAGKSPVILKWLIEKLIGIVRGIKKNGTGRPQG